MITTVPIANPKFQTSIFRNEARSVWSLRTSVKLRKPTLTFQPWARASPSLSTNRPLESSAVQVWPVSASLMQSQLAS